MTLKRIYAASSGFKNQVVVNPSQKVASSIKLSTGEDYTPRPGSLVTVTRAISARVNQNFDGFPSEELKKAHKSFLGRPVFVNHNNEDHTRTRGMIVDSQYKEAGDDKFIELTIEVDAVNFPKLASKIATGELDSVSMGTDVEYTKCSACDHKAYEVEDFCDHVKYHKGQKVSRYNPESGKREKVLVYESCYGLNFFEISYVFDPADETAINSKVYLPNKHAALNKEALGELTSPPSVDTLRNQETCPQCGDEDFDGKECSWCEYVTPPKEFQDPDVEKSRVLQIVRDDPNSGQEGRHMGSAPTKLQIALNNRRLADAKRRLAEDVTHSQEEERENVDYETDPTKIDNNPVSFDEAREPDGTADVTQLDDNAGVVKSGRKKSADFPPAKDDSAAPAAGPDPSADGPASDADSDASNSIEDLPITWQTDDSGQPFGQVDGTGMDIFVNNDMTWQVLPEGSDQPVQQGQGASYEDCIQQAFQAAQSGGGAGDPAQAAPAAPAPGGAPDPTKVSNRKKADGAKPIDDSVDPDERTEVYELPTYETVEPGTYTRKEYDDNASTNLTHTDNRTDVENFQPGGKGFDQGQKKAQVVRVSAVKALELVEAYIEHGIVPNERTAKFAAVAQVEKLSRDVVEDRLALLAQVEKGRKRMSAVASTSRPRNIVPQRAARVPNMTRSAGSSSAPAGDDDYLMNL